MVMPKLSIASGLLCREKLGDGPLRFGGAGGRKERSVKEQLHDLSPSERKCFDYIKAKWEKKYPYEQQPLTDELFLRFARCSPGDPFSSRAALKAMKKCPKHFRIYTATMLEQQLRKRVSESNQSILANGTIF